MSLYVGVYKLFDGVIPPSRATKKSACYDVRAFLTNKNRFVTVYDAENNTQQYVAYQTTHEQPLTITLNPGDRAMIPTGMILKIPENHSIRVHPRSGLSLKSGLSLPNCEGVVDEDYTEEFKVLLINHSDKKVDICHGDRIAQIELVVNNIFGVVEINEKPTTDSNREGGFGSTGKQ